MSTIEDLETTIQEVADKVGVSVVGIGRRWAMGSGVVVEPGVVLTNAHNVRRPEVSVTFSDGRTETGRAGGVDADGDVAVIEVDTGEVPALDWPDGEVSVRLGTPVVALANPGGRGLRVTFGSVSGTERSFRGPRGRRIAGSIEHTAPLLPGSSGGPVVDVSGRLVGINTNRLGEGFYLAIPADGALRERVEVLKRGEAPTRPRLGVGIAPAHVARGLRRAVGLPEIDGLLVRGVVGGGPAERAGLREGDLIVGAAGRQVKDVDALHEILDAHDPGAPLSLDVVRGTEETTVEVAVEEGAS